MPLTFGPQAPQFKLQSVLRALVCLSPSAPELVPVLGLQVHLGATGQVRTQRSTRDDICRTSLQGLNQRLKQTIPSTSTFALILPLHSGSAGSNLQGSGIRQVRLRSAPPPAGWGLGAVTHPSKLRLFLQQRRDNDGTVSQGPRESTVKTAPGKYQALNTR